MERQFKGIWIDAEIWLHPRLSAVDKVLLADIHSFTGNGKTFYKTNDTLAQELFVSVKTVSRSMKKLSEMGLIRIGGTKRKRVAWSLYHSGQIDQDTGHNVHDTSQNVPSDGTNCPTTNTRTNKQPIPLLKRNWFILLKTNDSRRHGLNGYKSDEIGGYASTP